MSDPAPGKAELNMKDWLATAHIQAAAVTTTKLSAAAKLKRACSNQLATNTQHAAAGLLYTTTAITITKVVAYATTVISAGNLKVEVGTNGDDDAVVNEAAISDKALDSVTVLTIASGAVAANKMVTATVHTASGDASETVLIAIEYYENE